MTVTELASAEENECANPTRGYAWSVVWASLAQDITNDPVAIPTVWFDFWIHPFTVLPATNVWSNFWYDGFGLTLTLNVFVVLFVISNHLPLA